MHSLYYQPPRIILYIFYRSVELQVVEYYPVVETVEESCLLPGSGEAVMMAGACAEEASQFVAELPLEPGMHVDHDMDMIRHDHKEDDAYLGMMGGDIKNLFSDAFPQWGIDGDYHFPFFQFRSWQLWNSG